MGHACSLEKAGASGGRAENSQGLLQGLHVAVVGASLGGLSAANVLRKLGMYETYF